MPTNTATLFISTVTDEFKSYRDAAHKWLDRPGVRIETQEKFIAMGELMLVKLSHYIQQCDAVVHLVGDRTGNEETGGVATVANVKALLDAHPSLKTQLEFNDAFIKTLSYTQWEAWLAIFHKRKLFIAVPEMSAPRDKRLSDAANEEAQKNSQHEHLTALAKHGRYPEIRFGNSDQLCLGLVSLRDSLLSGDPAVSSILSLADYRLSLTGFRQFLTNDALPFRHPEINSSYYPERLLAASETAVDGKGVLLGGAGGVGKTRTTFETAQLAEKRGWRVLFALPGEPAVTSERIIEAVLAHGVGKTLVVLEYLDQMHQLDLGKLKRCLAQASNQKKIQFGIIANCRPGFLLKPHFGRDDLFETVTLAPTLSEAESLSSYVVTKTAMKACKAIGLEAMLKVCGHRPIVALLVAQQLEKLARKGVLNVQSIQAVRSGDLAHWLRRRLTEDGLVTRQNESVWEASNPPAHLIAAASVLSCTPDDETGLVQAASFALSELGQTTEAGTRVVDVLKMVGWLENDGPWLYAVHDVVTDELLDQSIFDLERIRPREVSAILNSSSKRARSLGRMAKSLTRLAISENKSAQLHDAAIQWMRSQSAKIGQTLANEEATHGSYAMGAVFDASVFEKAAIECWPALIAPWLDKHGRDFEARHLLYRGLRAEKEQTLSALIPVALSWIELWWGEWEASFVLGPLLQIVSLENDQIRTISFAIKWLERFNDKLEAQYIFKPLLNHVKLTGESANKVIALAVEWLEQFNDKLEAQFVYYRLLGQGVLTNKAADKVIALATEWLKKFNNETYAGFVLKPLLSHASLRGKPADDTIALAVEWLEQFNDKPEAEFVYNALFGRDELTGKSAHNAIALAVRWLGKFNHKFGARFIFYQLLGRGNLKDEVAVKVITLAIEWLEKFKDKQEAEFIFKPLFGRTELAGEQAHKVITLAIKWLEKFNDNPEAEFVFKPLLGRIELTGELLDKVMAPAIAWLEKLKDKPEAGFVLDSLLSRADLRDEAAHPVIALAVLWLEKFKDKPEAKFVFRPLFKQAELKGESFAQVITLAIEWLETFKDTPEAGFVFQPILSQAKLKGKSANKVIALAVGWLDNFNDKSEIEFVINALLRRNELTGEAANKVIAPAVAWLEKYNGRQEAGFIFDSLLNRADLKGKSADRVIALAIPWLKKFQAKSEAPYVFKPLLGRIELREALGTITMQLACDWLKKWGEDQNASFVITPLLKRKDLGAMSSTVADHVALWISTWGQHEDACHILIAWFSSPLSKQHPKPQLETMATAWVEQFKLFRAGGPALALNLNLCNACSAPLVAKAQTWIQTHKNSLYVCDVIVALLCKYAAFPFQADFVIRIALDIAWHSPSRDIFRALVKALEVLPANHPLRDEVEVALGY